MICKCAEASLRDGFLYLFWKNPYSAKESTCDELLLRRIAALLAVFY